jgi:hypothetical protein
MYITVRPGHSLVISTLLHTGTEHPDLTWIVAASVLSSILAFGLGSYSTRCREFVRTLVSTSG